MSTVFQKFFREIFSDLKTHATRLAVLRITKEFCKLGKIFGVFTGIEILRHILATHTDIAKRYLSVSEFPHKRIGKFLARFIPVGEIKDMGTLTEYS
jgi:predicted transcriptional regulator